VQPLKEEKSFLGHPSKGRGKLKNLMARVQPGKKGFSASRMFPSYVQEGEGGGIPSRMTKRENILLGKEQGKGMKSVPEFYSKKDKKKEFL